MRPGQKLPIIAASALWLALAGIAGQARGQADVNQQAEALRDQGRYPEVIALLKRQIATLQGQGQFETALGATLLNNLGEMHYKLGRYAEAVPLYERSLSISNAQMRGPNPVSAVTYRNLGIVYQLTGRPADAFNAYSASIGMFQQIPNSAVQLASTMNNLATLLQDYKRFAEAEQALVQVLAIYQQSFGPSHQYVATAYNNLGKLYEKGGDLNRAELALTTAVRVMSESFHRDHPQRAPTLRNLGMFYGNKGDWARAVPLLREAFQILQKQAARSASAREGELSGATIDPELRQATVGSLINASMKLMMADQSQGVALSREVFAAGQWRPSQTAASLVQMSVRRLKGDGPLAQLVRQRQDLIAEWQAVEKRTTESALKGGTASSSQRSDIARLGEIDRTITLLDSRITKQFPDYADFANPSPLDVPAVQALLRDDEALALFIETGSPSWVWVITRKDKSLSLLNMSSEQLAEEVAALRCGVDRSNWANPAEWPSETAAEAQAKQTQRPSISAASGSASWMRRVCLLSILPAPTASTRRSSGPPKA
jgi:tetratricopeptide (TPR) repeat protein